MESKKFILSIVKKRVKEIDPDARIILFGSRARKDHHKDSDWDFLILTKQVVTIELKNQITDSFFEAELETDNILTSIIQNQYQWENYSGLPIYNNIKKDGIEL